MLGSQHKAPMPGVDEVEARAVEGRDRVVYLCFDVGDRRSAIPSQVARHAQCGPEKSSPVTFAPSRANDSVSVPM